jgi:Uma2 family endonuclease
VVTCDKEQFEDQHQDTLLNPVLLIEVLADSTEAYDRGRNFGNYRQIESLREYVLVTQDRQRIERFVRQETNEWVYSQTNNSDADPH